MISRPAARPLADDRDGGDGGDHHHLGPIHCSARAVPGMGRCADARPVASNAAIRASDHVPDPEFCGLLVRRPRSGQYAHHYDLGNRTAAGWLGLEQTSKVSRPDRSGLPPPSWVWLTRSVSWWSRPRPFTGSLGTGLAPGPRRFRACGVLSCLLEISVCEPIAHLVERLIRPDERIFVGMTRHDVLIQSNPLLYAVVGRRGSSRFDELHPGVADRADVQQEIIDAIDRYDVRLFVLWNSASPLACSISSRKDVHATCQTAAPAHSTSFSRRRPDHRPVRRPPPLAGRGEAD